VLRLEVTVVHEYFAVYGMNNSKEGIKFMTASAGAKEFCITPALKRKKKDRFWSGLFWKCDGFISP